MGPTLMAASLQKVAPVWFWWDVSICDRSKNPVAAIIAAELSAGGMVPPLDGASKSLAKSGVEIGFKCIRQRVGLTMAESRSRGGEIRNTGPSGARWRDSPRCWCTGTLRQGTVTPRIQASTAKDVIHVAKALRPQAWPLDQVLQVIIRDGVVGMSTVLAHLLSEYPW